MLLARCSGLEAELGLTVRIHETPSTQVVLACETSESVSQYIKYVAWARRTPSLPEPPNTTMSSDTLHV